MADTGKIATEGYSAGAIKYVVLDGFIPNPGGGGGIVNACLATFGFGTANTHKFALDGFVANPSGVGGIGAGISRGQVVNNTMEPLKQSTARNVMVLMVDSSDGKTGKTGLTLTITASKDGAAFATITPTVTERGNGWYNLALTSSHTDTLGDLSFHITGSGADACDFKLPVELDRTGVDTGGTTTLLGRITSAIAAKFAKSTLGFLDVVVGAGSTTTSIVLNSSTGINGGAPSSVDDYYNGAVLIFTTGTLAGQRTSVTDYTGSTKTLTVVALTSAPSNGDQGFLA